MSNENYPLESSSSHLSKKALITTILIIILLIVVGLVSYNLGKRSGSNIKTPKLGAKTAPKQREKLTEIPGRIIKIDPQEKKITLEAYIPVSSDTNTRVKKTLIVNTDENTIFTKKDLSKPPVPPKPGEKPKAIPEEMISFKDLKRGYQVTVSSDENFAGKKEFLASKILWVVTPGTIE